MTEKDAHREDYLTPPLDQPEQAADMPPERDRETQTRVDSMPLKPKGEDREPPLVVFTPEEKHEVSAPSVPQSAAPPFPERAQVHVAPNLLELATGRGETAAEIRTAKEQHDLNQVVHGMLIIGLAISTTLMLAGIVLEITRHQDLPTTEPGLSEVFSRILILRPSGFLGLGLLVLLATPMLRVIGSIFAFAYERDWRFAGITFLVFMVVVASILLGKG